MSIRQTINTLVRNLGFDRKRFFVFLVVFVVLFGTYLVWHSRSTSEADVLYTDTMSFANDISSKIEILKNGTVMIDGREKRGAVKYYTDYDEFMLKVFDNPPEYVTGYTATVHLPVAIGGDQVRPMIYAVHGVGDAISYQADDKTLVYQVSDIAPGSTVTIVARLNKGIISVPFFSKAKLVVEELTVRAWIYLAFGLPALAILLLIFIYLRRRSGLNLFSKAVLSRLPDDVAPALAGVVVDGAVGGREIAGTLLDLAQRGYIYIINSGNGEFNFGKRRLTEPETTEGLSDFERALLSKIFLPAAYKSTVADVEMRLGRHIFSKKVANFYVGVYDEAMLRGYFVSNPARVHLAFRNTGIALFFLSFLGFLYGAISNLDPKYALLFWLGGMGAAALVIRMAPFMPAMTSLGLEKAREWMAFREYLSMRENVESALSIEDKFNKFLPYAVVLGAEVEWMKRFRDARFTVPDWYDSTDQTTTIESFANSIFPIIGYVSKNLAKAHDPSTE